MSLLFKAPHTRQPQGAVEIDLFDSALAGSTRLLDAQSYPVDKVDASSWTSVGGAVTAPCAIGIGRKYNGTSQYDYSTISLSTSGSTLVLGGVFCPAAIGVLQVICAIGSQSNTGGAYAYISLNADGTVGAVVRRRVGADPVATLTSPFTVKVGGLLSVVLISRSDSNHSLYVNGIEINSTTNTNSGGSLDTLGFFTSGTLKRSTSISTSYYSGSTAQLWLSTADAGGLAYRGYTRNPWGDAYKPQARSLWMPGTVAGGGGVTGNLAATESGTDTFAGSGQIIVQGALSATESGADTASAAGIVIVQGAMSATETGADTAAINGSSTVTTVGAVNASEAGSDGCAATGKVLITGLLAAAESGGDTAYAVGQIYVLGTLTAQEVGSDTCVIRESEVAFDPSIYSATSPAISYLSTVQAQSYSATSYAQGYSVTDPP